MDTRTKGYISDSDHLKRTEFMPDLKQIKRNMRKVRSTHPEMTTANIARAVGLSPRTVRRWDDESDPTAPDLEKVVQVCCYFGISFDYLFKLHLTRNESVGRTSLRALSSNLATNATDRQIEVLLDFITEFVVPPVALAGGQNLTNAAQFQKGKK